MNRFRTALATGAAAVVMVGGWLALVPHAHAAAPALTATFLQTSVWSSGYGADVRIDNQGDAAATSWVVEFDLPTGSTISSSWSSVRTSTGQHHRFTNAAYNGDIAPGASETFGFNVKGTGTPANCTVNGRACAGGPSTPGPTTAGPSTPGPTTPGPTTPGPTPTGPTPSPSVPSGSTVDVSTAAQLRSALDNARPGQTIRLAAGTYQGPFITSRPGTASAPIMLTGPANAILTNDGSSGTAPSCPAPTAGWDPGYGLWLFDAAYWRLSGFSVVDTKKGVVLDNSHHVTIDGLTVRRTQDEGVHFRRSSADGIIRNSSVSETGLVQPGYGEGVYIGSSNSNFDCYGNSGGMDRSDRVQVLNNRIGPDVAAEHIDIKEGTQDGVVRGNTLDGRGISGQNSADSWVDVKGNGYLLEQNTGTFAAPGTFANGYETHNLLTGYGCGNVWQANTSDLGGVGRYAVFVSSTSKCSGNPNVVYASNTVRNATTGLTNVPVTQ